ncbi:MAG TPA: [protein-PII] uridylyltransferase, partial [Pirellulales bacterium]
TWEAVRPSIARLPSEVSEEAAGQFLSLLSQPDRLGELLRELHEMGILERLIPAMAHARSLLQFNEYHKFTVDEHCLRAVEAVAGFGGQQCPWGDVYRSLKQKRTLHLALLIHDLGKGFAEDHSEVGLRIADETAQRLHLPAREAETLKFLVHKHLVMSHLAFRRDTSDDQLIVKFAVDVGSPEVLQMLFVFTCADLAAVGPGVLNSWKGEVLADLYLRTLQHLSGDSPSSIADDTRATAVELLANDEPNDWFAEQIAALHYSYLLSTPPEQIADELRRLRSLERGEVKVWHRYLPETKTCEYTIGTFEDITPGVFHKLAGGLTSAGLQILSAEISTLAEELVLDRFRVHDPDYADEPPSERLAEVARRVTESLVTGQVPAFRRLWQSGNRQSSAALQFLPTRVRLDNSTSERFTIVDVFASDQMGLLFTISRVLFELNLSVSLAKIGTYLDQVVDVFYVTDQQGKKVEDEALLEQIRRALLDAIQQLSNQR